MEEGREKLVTEGGTAEKSGPAMRANPPTLRLLRHQIPIFRPRGKSGSHFLLALAAYLNKKGAPENKDWLRKIRLVIALSPGYFCCKFVSTLA